MNLISCLNEIVLARFVNFPCNVKEFGIAKAIVESKKNIDSSKISANIEFVFLFFGILAFKRKV